MTPQSAIVSATRSIICRTERSLAGVPRWPRKYLLATTLVARADQLFGELEVLLLEDDLAVLVGDGGIAQVPLDGVVRVDVGAREAPLDGQALPARLGAGGQLLVAGGPCPGAHLRLPVPVPVVAVAVGLVAIGGAVGGLRRGGGSGHGSVRPLRCSSAVEGDTDPSGPWVGWGSLRRSGAVRAPCFRTPTVIRRRTRVKRKTTTSGSPLVRCATRCSGLSITCVTRVDELWGSRVRLWTACGVRAVGWGEGLGAWGAGWATVRLSGWVSNGGRGAPRPGLRGPVIGVGIQRRPRRATAGFAWSLDTAHGNRRSVDHSSFVVGYPAQ